MAEAPSPHSARLLLRLRGCGGSVVVGEASGSWVARCKAFRVALEAISHTQTALVVGVARDGRATPSARLRALLSTLCIDGSWTYHADVVPRRGGWMRRDVPDSPYKGFRAPDDGVGRHTVTDLCLEYTGRGKVTNTAKHHQVYSS